ncbi:hypothetical protein [Clostridium perfringens]|uniref:hypothetical protein n=1 Tax=Clostridium perfringens TaxID=1502 RepID=UPI003B0114F2
MKELKCPRCKNEELQGNENYCPICGLDLEEKTAQEVPVLEQPKFIPENSKHGVAESPLEFIYSN